jgi:hypothetical protein
MSDGIKSSLRSFKQEIEILSYTSSIWQTKQIREFCLGFTPSQQKQWHSIVNVNHI